MHVLVFISDFSFHSALYRQLCTERGITMHDRALKSSSPAPEIGSIHIRCHPAGQLTQVASDRDRVLEAIEILIRNTDIAVSVSPAQAKYA